MNNKVIILILFVALLLSSCGSSRRYASKVTSRNANSTFEIPDDEGLTDLQKRVMLEAVKLVGTPYCYGGVTNDCYDCSGFVQTVFEKSGVHIPRISGDQYEFCKYVPESQIEPGDLIFFGTRKNITHVGIYVGKGMFVHSSSSKGVIIQSVYEDYYIRHFAGYRRVSKLNYLGKK